MGNNVILMVRCLSGPHIKRWSRWREGVYTNYKILKTVWKVASNIQDMDVSIKFKENFQDFSKGKPVFFFFM